MWFFHYSNDIQTCSGIYRWNSRAIIMWYCRSYEFADYIITITVDSWDISHNYSAFITFNCICTFCYRFMPPWIQMINATILIVSSKRWRTNFLPCWSMGKYCTRSNTWKSSTGHNETNWNCNKIFSRFGCSMWAFECTSF